MYSHFQNMHITCGKMYGNSYNNRFLYSQRLYQGSDSLFYSHHIGLSDPWKITGNNSEKMKNFIDLNFLHSQKILGAMNSNSSIQLVKELLESSAFVLYNRQYMMWYYGDLTIYGENRIKNLIPGTDVVNAKNSNQ